MRVWVCNFHALGAKIPPLWWMVVKEVYTPIITHGFTSAGGGALWWPHHPCDELPPRSLYVFSLILPTTCLHNMLFYLSFPLLLAPAILAQWIDYPDDGHATLTHYTLPSGYVASCGCTGSSTNYPTAALSQMAYGSSTSYGARHSISMTPS